MPRLPELNVHTLAVSGFALARGGVALALLCPINALSVFATFPLYLYLRYEHRINYRLVRNTPPDPEIHLPSRGEWVAN